MEELLRRLLKPGLSLEKQEQTLMERRAMLAEGKTAVLEELLLLQEALSALALHLQRADYVEFVYVFWVVGELAPLLS